LSVGVEVVGESRDIGVVGVRLETEFVLEGYGECEDEVDTRDLAEEIFFAEIAFSFLDVNPKVSGEVTALNRDSCPCFASVGITVLYEYVVVSKHNGEYDIPFISSSTLET
jgi:hypothetical protein